MREKREILGKMDTKPMSSGDNLGPFSHTHVPFFSRPFPPQRTHVHSTTITTASIDTISTEFHSKINLLRSIVRDRWIYSSQQISAHKLFFSRHLTALRHCSTAEPLAGKSVDTQTRLAICVLLKADQKDFCKDFFSLLNF